MSDSTQLRFDISTNDAQAKLGLEVWLNSQKLFDTDHVTAEQTMTYDIVDHSDDDLTEHELKFVLKNKTDADTLLDQSGSVISSAMITIKNIHFDDIDVSQLLYENSEYVHNFNGHGTTITEKFFGDMGCNGTVTMKFASPVYLWLLETM